MLLEAPNLAVDVPLYRLIDDLDVHEPDVSLGPDIDMAHQTILDPCSSKQVRSQAFFDWASRNQPCLFGRLGSKGLRGIGIDICWLDETDIRLGDAYIATKIQRARRQWKDSTTQGLSHGFLIMFNDPRLAYARPGKKLLQVCERISDLYLVEHAPVERDVIYTEAMPLRRGADFSLFKAGINLFYPSAHRTLNHDRRIPGGVMISVNSPGHLANSLVVRGHVPSLGSAVEVVLDIALRSIGNGGIGHADATSASWHNIETDPVALEQRCPLKRLPSYVPANHSRRFYSALYHTDVLVPTDVTVNDTIDPDRSSAEVWPWLIIDYITEQEFPEDHVNYGLFHGRPIPEEARYHNPWPPRRAYNSPLANY